MKLRTHWSFVAWRDIPLDEMERHEVRACLSEHAAPSRLPGGEVWPPVLLYPLRGSVHPFFGRDPLLYGSSIELYVDEAQAREDWGAWCEGLSALRHVLPAAEWSAWAGDEPIRFDADRQAYDPASVPAWRLEEDASPPAEAPPGAAAPPRELRTASRRHAAPPGLYRLFGQDIFSREEEAYEIADFTTLEKACAERDRRRRSSGAAADLADHYFVVDDRGWLRG